MIRIAEVDPLPRAELLTGFFILLRSGICMWRLSVSSGRLESEAWKAGKTEEKVRAYQGRRREGQRDDVLDVEEMTVLSPTFAFGMP